MGSERQQSLDVIRDRSLDALGRDSMRRGSLSFFLASRLLPGEMRKAIFRLYLWCRHCDDVIDQASLKSDRDELEQRLRDLKEATLSCYQRRDQTDPIFRAFAELVQQYRIPKEYPLELLAGMEMDIKGYHYRSFQDLRLYCYRVAGTVGLMSCHIFGIRNEEALSYADALGQAMQLTNISRDIIDDARLNRVYIPDEWFDNMPLQASEILSLPNREPLVPLARRLIAEAEALYQEGEKGLMALPWQCSLAVSAAGLIYAEIGNLVIKRGACAWDQRTWVPTKRKLLLAGQAFLKSIQAWPSRIQNPWNPQDISIVRRPS